MRTYSEIEEEAEEAVANTVVSLVRHALFCDGCAALGTIAFTLFVVVIWYFNPTFGL